jgi:hypothetical protein
MDLFPGIYLRQKRGLMGLLGGYDWLRGSSLHDVELESTEFHETYELKVVKNQDEGRLRELFDPETIVWLTDHPLRAADRVPRGVAGLRPEPPRRPREHRVAARGDRADRRARAGGDRGVAGDDRLASGACCAPP